MELRQYYIADTTLLAVDPVTCDIIRIMPVAPPHLDLDAGRVYVVGAFLHFDVAARILHTESGIQLRLQPHHMEKSRVLKEKTKVWLAALTK